MKLINFVFGFLFLLTFIYISFSQEVLTGIKVFEGRWGDSPQEVGLKKDYIDWWGATNFWPEGDSCFYIADFPHKEVKKFNRQGSLLWRINLPHSPIYLLKLDNNRFLVLTASREKYKIIEFDVQSNIIKKSPLIKIPYSNANAFLRTYKNKIYLQDPEHAIILDNDLNILYRIDIPRRGKFSLYLDKNYLFPITYRNFQHNPYIEIHPPMKITPSMKLNRESLQEGIKLQTQNALQELVGTDGQGNFYIERIYRHLRNHLIIKLSPEGRVISEKYVRYDNIQAGVHPIKILPNGDIYILNSNRKKYWIEKYPAEWFNE